LNLSTDGSNITTVECHEEEISILSKRVKIMV